LDSTSFHLHGKYAQEESLEPEIEAIEITYGYLRDHRPDLKQFMMNLICVGDGDIPVCLEMASENQSDKDKTAATKLSKELILHELSEVRIVEKQHYERPGKESAKNIPTRTSYQVTASIVTDEKKITVQKQRAGRFILATNVLDSQELSADDALKEYKAQQGTERGFRFLKDPLFFASSVFLKTPKRIAVMGMIMALCLLVYNLAQRQLRKSLSEQEETIPNQLGKPTVNPTLRWVFQCFMAVHLVTIEGVKQIVNFTDERMHILKFFSPACQSYYLLLEPDT
jgi:transposase